MGAEFEMKKQKENDAQSKENSSVKKYLLV